MTVGKQAYPLTTLERQESLFSDPSEGSTGGGNCRQVGSVGTATGRRQIYLMGERSPHGFEAVVTWASLVLAETGLRVERGLMDRWPPSV